MAKTSGKKRAQLPSKDELVAFIGAQPGKVGTREIARAFNLKNNDRATLKRMLRELGDEGRLERRRRKLHPAGALPSVVVADITERDRDGELIALPTEWDEEAHGPAPRIRVHVPRRARPAEIAGVGDRVLLRTEETEDDGGIRHSGRVTKIMDRAKLRVLGIFRPAPDGGGRLGPIDKKQMGKELTIPPNATGGAQEGDLVAVEIARQGRLGLPVGHVKERLGSLKSERAVSSDRHPRPFAAACLPARGFGASRRHEAGVAGRPRGLAQIAAHYHRSSRRQGSRRRGACHP